MTSLEREVDEVLLGSARGGRKPHEELQIEIVRMLGQDDIEVLQNPPAIGAKPPLIGQIRHTHHQLAQLLAKGHNESEASLITGYSPAHISNLKLDPTFQELLSHYQQEREAIFVDVLERMKALGLSTLDEIQRRMEDNPEKISFRELQELAELTLVKGRQQGGGGFGGGGSNAPPINLNVKFVGASSASIDVTPQRPAIEKD